MARALCAATVEWWGNSLMKLRARVRSVKETKNTSQWLPEPKNTIRQWSRTPKCDPKKFPTELKNTKIANLFGSHFGVRLHWRIVFFGSASHCEVFLVSLTDRTLARNSLTSLGFFVGLWGYKHLGLYSPQGL